MIDEIEESFSSYANSFHYFFAFKIYAQGPTSQTKNNMLEEHFFGVYSLECNLSILPQKEQQQNNPNQKHIHLREKLQLHQMSLDRKGLLQDFHKFHYLAPRVVLNNKETWT